MSRAPPRRYVIRNAAGEELVVPSLAVLHDLYQHGFVSDEDLVKMEGAALWRRAGSLPALHGVRERRADPRRVALLVAAVAAVVTALALLWR